MVQVITLDWWTLAVQGGVALFIGLLVLFWPSITLEALLFLLGTVLLIDGLFSLVDGWRRWQRRGSWWPRVLRGLGGVAAGLLTFFWPALTATVLAFIIGIWAVATGVIELYAGLRLRDVISRWWVLSLAGVLSITVGALILANPAAGALAFVLLIGAYFAALGILLLVVAFALRSRIEASR